MSAYRLNTTPDPRSGKTIYAAELRVARWMDLYGVKFASQLAAWSGIPVCLVRLALERHQRRNLKEI